MRIRSGRRGVAALLAALVLATGVGWLVRVWISGGTAPNAQASVLGFVVTAAVAVTGLAKWARRENGEAMTSEQQLKGAGDTLARLVRQQWRGEATARALGDPEPIPVRWRLASPSLMDHPEMITNGAALGVRRQLRADRPAERGLPGVAPTPAGDHRWAGHRQDHPSRAATARPARRRPPR
jgi:hypothetical protein